MASRPDSQDVMLALMAFDAYNRGSNTQLRYSSRLDDFLASSFGGASLQVISDDALPEAAKTIGFSASSYDFNGKTVISYRGTDFNFNSVNEGIQTLSDIGTGWASSFGILGTDIEGVKLQPSYAADFYKEVTGSDLFPSPGGGIAPSIPPENVIVTGHSLGGGLAGYVASLAHIEGVIFNEIPFLGMALSSSIADFIDGLLSGNPRDFVTPFSVDIGLIAKDNASFALARAA